MTVKMNRRTLLKLAPIATAGAVTLRGNNYSPTAAGDLHERVSAGAGGSYGERLGREIRLGNRKIQLGFDTASGALLYLHNKVTGRQLRISPEAAAPLRLWVGTRGAANQAEAVISRSRPQAMDYQFSAWGEDISLCLHWENLAGGKSQTGVAVTQTLTLSAEDDYARIRTRLVNRGYLWVTRLFLGLEALILNPDPKAEILVAGTEYVNPRGSLPAGSAYVKYPAGRRSFSIPPTVPQSLLTSWMDLSDSGAGLGTGYLDRQDMDLVGDVQAQPDGLTLGWRLFRLEGTRGFMWGFNGPEQLYPLAPGEHFNSDEWILVFHSGDWHHTAEAYRRRYEVAFKDDYLDWEHTSPRVRKADVLLVAQLAWGKQSSDPRRAYDYPAGEVINHFADLPPRVDQLTKALEVAPENILIFTLGTARKWGIYELPDYFPINQEAGGQAGAEEMIQAFQDFGIGGIAFYAHPYFNHRKAANYVSAADTGWNYPHQDWHTSMGGIACIAVEEWYDLWTKQIYPRYVSMGVSGLYLDEGYKHEFICYNPQHCHGSSALGVLTAQSRGANRIYRAWRQMAGPSSFLCCESGSDVEARNVDLWDWVPNEILRYTHPDKLGIFTLDKHKPLESVGRALVFGCPLWVRPFVGANSEVIEGELLQALRRFVKLRREMREHNAPGYPCRFRGTLGLKLNGGDLMAKVYADKTGITTVYSAVKSFEGELIVDGPRLGHPELGMVRRSLKLARNEMGYVVVKGK
jgi:hypothetical protein